MENHSLMHTGLPVALKHMVMIRPTNLQTCYLMVYLLVEVELLLGVLATYGNRNSILVDGVTSVHSEVITYWNFGKQEDWVIQNCKAVQYSCYPAGMYFGGFFWGGGAWTGTLNSLKIQNNTIEGAHGQAFVIYDNGLVDREPHERILLITTLL